MNINYYYEIMRLVNFTYATFDLFSMQFLIFNQLATLPKMGAISLVYHNLQLRQPPYVIKLKGCVRFFTTVLKQKCFTIKKQSTIQII